MILIVISFHGSKRKIFESYLLNLRKALQRGHFHSFAEKGRGPDLEDPLSCAPETGILSTLPCSNFIISYVQIFFVFHHITLKAKIHFH